MKLIYESVDGVPGGADEIAASFGECGGAVCVEAEDDFCDCWGDGSAEYFGDGAEDYFPGWFKGVTACQMDDSFFTFPAGSAAVVRVFGWVISMEVGLGFEAQVREFEGCEFGLRGNNG